MEWDYIPGNVFEIITQGKLSKAKHENTEYIQTCSLIAKLLNSLLASEDNIPEEILCSILLLE